MRIESRKALSLAALFFFVVWIILYIRGHGSEFGDILNLSLMLVAALCFVLLIDSIVLGLFTKVLMQYLNIRLKFNEWYGLSLVSNLWNYIIPFQGGAGARAIYLKKVHNFAIPHFLGTMLALYFISFFVNAVIGLFCILYIHLQYHYTNMIVFYFFAVVFVTTSLLMLFSPKVPEFKNWLLKKISEVINAWYGIRRHRALVLRLVLIILLHAVFELLTVYYGFKAYGVSLSFFKCLLLSTLLAFSVLIKITPGSLGITEGIIVFGAQIFGIPPAQSLLAAGLIRVVNLVLIFTLGPIYNYILSLNLKMRNNAEVMPVMNP
ncbi:MAG TPA: lysylphosphatidylglycerol synthase transmembrane domain-containing protein [Desulfatiglandales bacterium]|nr:lysylphosphatidylglycerol synthase transmembrane domain-containing protein [Desulfatiglandales bacterium]